MIQIVQNYRLGTLEVADVPPPVVRPGAVLIRTCVSAVSGGTERHLVEMGRKSLLGKAIARPDLVRRTLDKVKSDGLAEAVQQVRQRLDALVPLGYSAAGVVTAVGEGVSGIRVDDRVACGGQGVAVHAEVLCSPATLIAPIPPQVSFEDASFAMVGAIALHAVRLCAAQPGEWVAVIGLGLIGLLAVQMLRAAGLRVVGMDVIREKLRLGKALGAEEVVDSRTSDAAAMVQSLTDGQGVDAVLIAAGDRSNEPLESASRISRVHGKIVATGLVNLNVPRHMFFEKELSLVVSRASGPGLFDPIYATHGKDYPYPFIRWTHARNMEEFLRLVASGAVELRPLITHRFPVSRALEAFEVLKGGGVPAPIGIALEYPDRSPDTPSVIRFKGREERRDARKAIRVGLVGAGLFARTTLLPELQRVPGLRLRGVATASGASAYHVAKKYRFDYATANPQEILDDPDIDCVLIATRHDSHARLAAAALRAGKDVFVEKPLALTYGEVSEMVEAWRAGQGRFMVGFNRRHSNHSLIARDFLAGTAGPAIFHLRVNAGDVPRGSWVNDPLSGGDRVRGELCHFVDLAHYFMNGHAVSVEAAGLPAARAHEPFEDLTATLHFGCGSLANLFYTSRGHRSLERERIEGYRGGRAVVIENFRRTRFYGLSAPRTYRTWRIDRGYRGELSEWFQSILEGKASPVRFADYLASTIATLSISEALATKGRISVEEKILELVPKSLWEV